MHEFDARDGNKYYIDLNGGQKINVYDSNDNNVGSVTLLHVNADSWEMPSYFYVQDLNLNECKRLGIGTEIFRLHNEIFGELITAASEFGPRMDDGSHLINDGIPFVAKMREKGFICAESNDEGEF